MPAMMPGSVVPAAVSYCALHAPLAAPVKQPRSVAVPQKQAWASWVAAAQWLVRMQPSSAWQLVLAAPVRSSQPHALGEPKNASHLLTSHDEHSERPVNLQTASQAGVKLVAGALGGSQSSPGCTTP